MKDCFSRDIVLFSTADWDNPFWTNKQYMAMLLASRGHRVLYVDSLGLRRPTLQKRDVGRILGRLWKAFPISREVCPNVWRVSPLVLPFHAVPSVRAFNTRLLHATLLWHMRLIGMEHPVIWTYNPVVTDLCKQLAHSGLVYHCVDDLRAAPHVDPMVIEAHEKQLGAMADLCFTTSRALEERMSTLFPRVVYEPNVCDPVLFGTARLGLPEPEALRHIPHPRLLFVGALSDYKVDYGLMEATAHRLPDVHWVLIGQEGEGQPDSARPPVLPNIHVLGTCHHGRLPHFMAHADVAVLPAPLNAYTNAMFPMKFFEYLAAGLQVVSTNLPALKEFSELCFLADSEEAFINSISRVLEGEQRDADRIKDACHIHSWQARYARMETIFTSHFGTSTTSSSTLNHASATPV